MGRQGEEAVVRLEVEEGVRHLVEEEHIPKVSVSNPHVNDTCPDMSEHRINTGMVFAPERTVYRHGGRMSEVYIRCNHRRRTAFGLGEAPFAVVAQWL